MAAPLKSAQQAEARLRFEMLLAEVCAEFVNVAPTDLDSKISHAQRVICEALGVDHSSLWRISEDNPDIPVMTHVYRDPHLKPLPPQPNAKEYFPWSYRKILNKEIVCVPNTATLPPEAATDKESWENYGIHSSLVVPLTAGNGVLIGVLAFDSLGNRDWAEPLRRRLQILALVFAQALDRKNSEQRVRESENRFRLIADTAPVLIWMSGTDKVCTYFNKFWLDFTGRSMEQELGNGWTEGVHSDDLRGCLDTYTQSFDRREKFRMEYRLRHHDGQYRWILAIGVPRFNQDGSFAGYIGTGVDVTDRKLTERALRISEERLRLAQQAAQIGSFELNYRTGVNTWTPELEAIYGLSAGSFGGTKTAFEDLVHPDDRSQVIRLTNESMKTGCPMAAEWRVVWPDKSVHWVTGRWQVFMDESGEPLRMVGVNIDITEHKRAEDALGEMTRKFIQAQEQERSRIGRELHDDINQRLAMLAIELEQLKDNPSELGIRVQELRRQMTDIASDVQALSHDLHSSQLEYLGAVAGMKSWCKEFAERQKMEVDFGHDVASTLPREIGLCLFRVIQEALHNAAKHSGVKRIEVELSEDSCEIHLTIRDFGKGFDVETVKQSKGLGLTSMRERVRLVNGNIEFRSKPMAGTTIHVRIPRESQSALQREAV